MRNLSLRLACVFIILIFLLAPLGAVNLNQDNNTKYINQDDDEGSIAVEDVNVTVDDVDDVAADVDTADITDDIGTADINDDISDDIGTTDNADNTTGKIAVNNNTEGLNESNNSPKEYDYFSIHADDIYEGESALIEIRTHDFINTGVYVLCNGHYEFLWVKNGYGSIRVDGLKAGTYTAKVMDQETLQTNETSFLVREKIEPGLSVEVEDIDLGQKASAEVHADKGYTGEVTLTLDGSKTKTISLENGYGKAIFDDGLKPGQHTVEAISSSAGHYKESQVTTRFNVSSEIPLDVQVDDVTQGEPIVVKVNTIKDYNGFLCLLIEDVDMGYGSAENGYFTCSFDSADLTPGTHEITVHAFSKGDYKPNTKKVQFNVKQKESH